MNLFRSNFNARAWLAAATATLALIACGGGGGDTIGAFETNNAPGATPPGTSPGTQPPAGTAVINAFAATLTGAQEVPANQSTGTGSGTVVVNPATRQMLATVTTTGVPGNAAHIHEAAPGVSGPIVFPLTESAPGNGVWTGTATLTEAQFNTLKAGGYYFNVHSAAFPNGEIRGQIRAHATTDTGAMPVGTGSDDNPTTPATSFLGALTGAQEVPPTGSAGQGAGALLANAATREVSAAVVTTGIPGNAAHVHQAAPGVNGPIIVPLTETPPGSGIWAGKGILTPEQFTALQSGNMYFNVHSAAFPNGEIRGQLLMHHRADDSGGTAQPPASATQPADDNPSPGEDNPASGGTSVAGDDNPSPSDLSPDY